MGILGGSAANPDVTQTRLGMGSPPSGSAEARGRSSRFLRPWRPWDSFGAQTCRSDRRPPGAAADGSKTVHTSPWAQKRRPGPAARERSPIGRPVGWAGGGFRSGPRPAAHQAPAAPERWSEPPCRRRRPFPPHTVATIGRQQNAADSFASLPALAPPPVLASESETQQAQHPQCAATRLAASLARSGK